MNTVPLKTDRKVVDGGRNIINRHERSFKRGSLMFIEGEVSTEMFIIKSGKVRILKQEGQSTIELATLGAGSVLGELALLDHQPRSATAQVVEDINATIIDETLLESTLAKIPSWLADIIKVVVKRLRDTMKKTSDDVVRKSVAGVIRIMLLLAAGNDVIMREGSKMVSLEQIKTIVYTIIGLGSMEAENCLLHLIFKDLVVIRKIDDEEFIVLKNPEALALYLNYIRTKQRGGMVAGEDFSDDTMDLVGVILAAGEKNGTRLQNNIIKIGVAQIELELERLQKGRYINFDALDKLTNSKVLIRQDDATESTFGTHKRTVLLYNVDTLKRLHVLRQWLPTFKEEIAL